MLNKTIIVFYINVGNLSQEEVAKTIDSVRELIKPTEEDEDKVIHYIIPVRDSETRVECINAPTFIADKKMQEEAINRIATIDRRLDRITSTINSWSETRKVRIEKKF